MSDDQKNLIAELRHERGLYPWTSCVWRPSWRCLIGWYCWSSFGWSNKTYIPRGHKIRYSKPTLFTSVYFIGYSSIRSRVTRSGPKSSHRCTTSFNGGIRGRCLKSGSEPGTSINPSYNQFIYKDTPRQPWIHHLPGLGPGGGRIWHTRYDTVLKIYQDKRVVSVESQDPCDPR